MASDERIRRALLAGLTVVALAVGAGWWRAAAPTLGPTAPDPTPSADASLQPGIRVVDPRTGQVLPGPEADPGEAVVIHQEPGDPTVSVVSDVLWHDGSHLRPGDLVERQISASPGQRYLLTVGCAGAGAGALTVRWSGTDEDDQGLEVACGTRVDHPLTAGGGPLLVRFTATGSAVDLDARLAWQS
ncbi:hypothetical protein ACFFMM_14640 [Micromonospora chaiyaphumensis]|uniref:hypothetical protein n=1 Tax=Micromonospora chaiyaphumensis TaxID=307119 RepID=UPI0011131379|nr:hypothetical protein [Micromonospora chaiyaphumensis]